MVISNDSSKQFVYISLLSRKKKCFASYDTVQSLFYLSKFDFQRFYRPPIKQVTMALCVLIVIYILITS